MQPDPKKEAVAKPRAPSPYDVYIGSWKLDADWTKTKVPIEVSFADGKYWVKNLGRIGATAAGTCEANNVLSFDVPFADDLGYFTFKFALVGGKPTVACHTNIKARTAPGGYRRNKSWSCPLLPFE